MNAIKRCPEASGVKFLSIDTTKPHWDADETLCSLCREQERREDLRNVGVDISGFPMIVAVIDEYSDLVNFGSRDSRRTVKASVLVQGLRSKGLKGAAEIRGGVLGAERQRGNVPI